MKSKLIKLAIHIIIGIAIGFIYYFSLRFEYLYTWMRYVPQQTIFLGNIITPVVLSTVIACLLGKNCKERVKNALLISFISVISFLTILCIVWSNTMYHFD